MADHQRAGLAPARFVRIPLAAELTGYSAEAIMTKVRRGVWLEGREYVIAPDRNVLIDLATVDVNADHPPSKPSLAEAAGMPSTQRKSAPRSDGRTALYRHFDEDGALLYVGVSLSALARLGQHQANAHWFGCIANVTIQWFETRSEAMEAELAAIRSERPKYNIAGRPL
jgi:predicted GIY-YIG superfamily endonuclease